MQIFHYLCSEIMSLRTFIDRYALIIAMVIGVLGYRWFRHLDWLTSPLIFTMLFFTFCKINPLELRLHRWHFVVLGVQLALVGCALAGYVALQGCAPLAGYVGFTEMEGFVLCFVMPTATAAPIIAGKLGGSIKHLTTFTLLSNFLTALLVPALFPLMNESLEIGFWSAAWQILCRVAPLLVLPFVLAGLVRLLYSEWGRKVNGEKREFQLNKTWSSMPFYLWIVLLVVLMSKITYTLLTSAYSVVTIVMLCVGALLACGLQFVLGWWIGRRFPVREVEESRVTAGQAFGQKNTALGIWMAQMFLHPLSALAPAAYIIWQNLLNSYQLWKVGKKK